MSTYCKLGDLSTVYLMLITSDKDNCSTQGMLGICVLTRFVRIN